MKQESVFFGLFALLAACGPGPEAESPKAKAAATRAAPVCPTTVAATKGDPETASTFEGQAIGLVCVIGPRGLERAAAEKAILAKTGDRIAPGKLREDLRKALDTGLFSDGSVFIEKDGASNDLVVVFELTPRPRVATIAFEGSKVFGDDALASKLPLEKGAPYDARKMTAVARALEDEYRSRGYLACGVRFATAPAAQGAVDVKVSVFEGPLHRFAKIGFKGNKRISEADLVKASALEKGEPYTRDKVEKAALAIATAYYDRGMVQAKIDVERDESTDAVGTTYLVDEGDVFTVGKLMIAKDGKSIEKELLARMKTKPGQTFSRKDVLEDLDRIARFLGERNLHGEMSPSTELDAKKKTVDVTIDVAFR